MIPSYIVAGAISDTIRQLPASGGGEGEDTSDQPPDGHLGRNTDGHIKNIYVS